MSDLTVSIRYARALFEEAERSGEVASVDEDVVFLGESLSSAPELQRLLLSPVVSSEKKAVVLKSLLADRLQPLTFRFVRLLLEKERENLLPQVVAAYRRLRDEKDGIVPATAFLAWPIDEREESLVREAVARLTGKQVRLKVVHNPLLIGGIVVRVGDMVYDGSVLHQLESLREHLQPGHVTVNGDGQLRHGPPL